jgi:hypothetical protein
MFAAEIGFSRCEVVLRNAHVDKAELCVQLRSQTSLRIKLRPGKQVLERGI